MLRKETYMAMGEMRDLVPEVENISQHKSSMFTIRDIEKTTFNIIVANEDKLSEIKVRYDNISAPEKVKFHRNTSDMLYYDYLSLSLKNPKLSSYAMKLEGKLRKEKASSRGWKTRVKRLESQGPQQVKSSLDEKEKLIQNLKKKLKMSATENPQTTELVSLEQEKEAFLQEALDYKARVFQLEEETMKWSQEKNELLNRVVVVPSTIEVGPNIEGLVQSMSQVSLKEGEIKGIKESIEKLKREIQSKDERMVQFRKENQALQERIDKLKIRLRGKRLLQGAKHIIWDSIAVEVAKFRVYLNFITNKDNIDITARSRCIVVNETLAKKPSEWAKIP
jgi:hypothetical protein